MEVYILTQNGKNMPEMSIQFVGYLAFYNAANASLCEAWHAKTGCHPQGFLISEDPRYKTFEIEYGEALGKMVTILHMKNEKEIELAKLKNSLTGFPIAYDKAKVGNTGNIENIVNIGDELKGLIKLDKEYSGLVESYNYKTQKIEDEMNKLQNMLEEPLVELRKLTQSL